MRIIIDFQSYQAPGYRVRGIGRYSRSLTCALLRLRGEHDVILLLNGAFADSIDELKSEFADLLPPDNIKVWQGIPETALIYPANTWRSQASELLREDYIASLKPDMVLVSHLFQGIVDASVVSIKRYRNDVATAVIFYDLIPLIYPEQYLQKAALKNWYHERLAHLRRADLVLAISDSSRLEAIEWGGFHSSQAVNVSSAYEPDFFKPSSVRRAKDDATLAHLNISGNFVLYTAGEDERKNLRGFVRAFALLPRHIIDSTVAVIVCCLPVEIRAELLSLAADSGLPPGTLLLTDYVSDDELLLLYRRCAVFVFPSLHEGFGLPALEAMACGAPTIASNRSSLPEVIGRDDALFDPYDDADIARVMAKVLTDAKFRKALRRHALQQAAKFSWDRCAERAWEAMERFVASRPPTSGAAVAPLSRPRLAFVSPMPPEQTGIADYSAELLPMLAKHYDIDVIVAQEPTPELELATAYLRVRGVAWFERHAAVFDRIVYQFGNSPFHAHMLRLLARFPGIVVMHDFYLSGLISHTDAHGGQPGLLARTLQRSHGWPALQVWRDGATRTELIKTYPCNLPVLEAAQGVIVHSEYSKALARQWYGDGAGADWAVIPAVKTPEAVYNRARARMELGLDENRFLVCTFGALDITKYNVEIISAWLQTPLAANAACELVMVGDLPNSSYGRQLSRMQLGARAAGRIRFTGRVSYAVYRRYLAAADMAVQLRRYSRGETSAAVLDCMSHGIPTIVNANGSMGELPAAACLMLPDEFSISELSRAMTELHAAPETQARLGRAAAEHIKLNHHAQHCAELYAEAIEGFVDRACGGATGLIDRALRLGLPSDGRDLQRFVERAAQICGPYTDRRRQLLVDVSAIATHDLKTGIQRVTRSILMELLKEPPPGFRVEPIQAVGNAEYRYAARFTAALLGLAPDDFIDEPLATFPGDIYLSLDWNPLTSVQHKSWLDELRVLGIATYFYVYDILPILRPEFFPDHMRGITGRWLDVVARADGLVCISQHVAATLARWLDMHGPGRQRPYQVGWAPLGADIDIVIARSPVDAVPIEAILGLRPSFLMVGTIEPRKGHLQVLAAFELLWARGIDVNLVLVGKPGFEPAIGERIDRHPEAERRLFWLERIDDYGLERAYSGSKGLIMASADEGFGLPLIEAARHGLPIIARDIPIFREVAGDHAFYFEGNSPQGLAAAIRSWMALDAEGRAPASGQIGWLTWKQSTEQLLDLILNDKWQRRWIHEPEPDLVARMSGADHRVNSLVGERRGEGIRSAGKAGSLVFGPYLPLRRGRYVARLYGSIGLGGIGHAVADVSVHGGQRVLVAAELTIADRTRPTLLAELPFDLEADVADLECRVRVTEFSDVQIDMIEIWQGDEKLLPPTADTPAEIDYVRSKRGFRLWATHPLLHSLVGNRVDRVIWTSMQSGYVVYGPYLPVRAGCYRAKVFGSVDDPASLGDSILDCIASPNTETAAVKRIAEQEAKPGVLVEVEIELPSPTDHFEVRVWADAGASFEVTGVELAPFDGNQSTNSGRPVKEVTLAGGSYQR